MNTSKILNILLATALLVLLIKTQIKTSCLMHNQTSGEKGENIAVDKEEIVLNNIFSRKSVRTFTDQEVSKDKLETLVKAAMAAPTAVNKQPWHFVVITKRELLNALADNLQYAQMLKEATAAIVVCADMEKTLPGIEQEYWIQDCSAASQNILLAAEAAGLGAVWTGVHPMPERIALVARLINLPENIKPLNLIVIGHPKGDTPAKDKWNEKALHFDVW